MFPSACAVFQRGSVTRRPARTAAGFCSSAQARYRSAPHRAANSKHTRHPGKTCRQSVALGSRKSILERLIIAPGGEGKSSDQSTLGYFACFADLREDGENHLQQLWPQSRAGRGRSAPSPVPMVHQLHGTYVMAMVLRRDIGCAGQICAFNVGSPSACPGAPPLHQTFLANPVLFLSIASPAGC